MLQLLLLHMVIFLSNFKLNLNNVISLATLFLNSNPPNALLSNVQSYLCNGRTIGVVNKGRHVTLKYFSILITLIKSTDCL